MKRIYLRSLVVLLVAVFVAQAGPNAIHYQGKLMQDGEPVSGVVEAVVQFYQVMEAGEPLYEEQQRIVVIDGIYGMEIGSNTPLPTDLFRAHDVIYMELTLDGEVMRPRERILAVPYAISADHAAHAAVADRLASPATSEIRDPAPAHIDTITNVSFFAHRDDLDQNIGTNGEKKIFWRAEEFDTATSMDLVNDRFVAPVTGYYRLTVQALIDPPPNPKNDPAFLSKVVLMRNSTNRLAVDVARYRKGAAQSVGLTRDVKLTSGDEVEVFIGHSHKGACVMSGKSYHTYFSGFLIHQ